MKRGPCKRKSGLQGKRSLEEALAKEKALRIAAETKAETAFASWQIAEKMARENFAAANLQGSDLVLATEMALPRKHDDATAAVTSTAASTSKAA